MANWKSSKDTKVAMSFFEFVQDISFSVASRLSVIFTCAEEAEDQNENFLFHFSGGRNASRERNEGLKMFSGFDAGKKKKTQTGIFRKLLS